MKFRLLGPVEVEANGVVLALPRRRERCLLGVLLLHLDQVVPVDRLVSLLWDDEPPERPRRAIHGCVSRIRTLLHGADAGDHGVALLTTADGYRLTADPDTIDARRFHTLVARATATDEPEQRARQLREALDLWRGRPLDNAATDRLREQLCARLVEQRLNATEDLFATCLLLRREREILPELVEVARGHPGREGLAALQMRALYQAGRRVDALDVFTRTRDYLGHELGLDPSPALRDLHQVILRDELVVPAATSAPTADGPAARADSGEAQDSAVPEDPVPRTAPRQLPMAVAHFTGRAEQLDHLVMLMSDSASTTRVATIAGTAGVGKSALAIHAAHALADRFPDGQLYIDLQGATDGGAPLAPIEVLGRFLRALGVGARQVPTEPAEAAARFRSEVASRALLIVLDNAREAAQVTPLLPGTADCGVLVTSRWVLGSLPASSTILLEHFSDREAVELLTRIAGDGRIAAEPEAARELVRCCGNLPLALRIAAGRLAARPQWPVAALAQRLRDSRHRLDELSETEVAVRNNFAVSFAQLQDSADAIDRVAAETFTWLGLPDGPDISLAAAARLCDRPERDAQTSLERLVDAGLLDSPTPGRYRPHDLLRLYAREQVRGIDPQDQRVALHRLCHFYTATAWHTLALLRPGDRRVEHAHPDWTTGGLTFPNATAAMTWVDTERANLLAVAHQAADTAGLQVVTTQLAQALLGYLLARCYWVDGETLQRLAVRVATENDDHAGRARALDGLAITYARQDRTEAALVCLDEALEISRERDDRTAQAPLLNHIGNVRARQGRAEEAAQRHQESLALLADDDHGRAACLDNLGFALFLCGRYERALACHQQSLSLARRLGIRNLEATSLGNLVESYLALGRHEPAYACLQGGLAIFDELGDLAGQADVRRQLGRWHHLQGNATPAVEHLRSALQLARRANEPACQAECLRDLGSALIALGQPEQAERRWREALAIYEQVGSTEAGRIKSLLADTSGRNGAVFAEHCVDRDGSARR